MKMQKQIGIKFLSAILFCLLLSGCAAQTAPATEEALFTEILSSTPEPLTVEEICSTSTPPEPAPAFTDLSLQKMDYFANADNQLFLWSNIDIETMDFYPFGGFNDYIYDSENNLWMAGGFGILKIKPDGQLTQYTMKDGLPHNNYDVIAVAPNGDIWAGGYDNTLVHFDGQKWVNEGEKLPEPFDINPQYICRSSDIAGIDFADDGSVWVMNGEIELYHQVGDQWVNVYFPKEILPIAGGGGCPIGIRARSETNITVARSGC